MPPINFQKVAESIAKDVLKQHPELNDSEITKRTQIRFNNHINSSSLTIRLCISDAQNFAGRKKVRRITNATIQVPPSLHYMKPQQVLNLDAQHLSSMVA